MDDGRTSGKVWYHSGMAESVQCSECKRSVKDDESILFGAPHDKELKRVCVSCFENIAKKPEEIAER